MRSFVFAFLFLVACRGGEDDIPYSPTPPERQEVTLPDGRWLLTFTLPDGWRRDGNPEPGFRYVLDDRRMCLAIRLERPAFERAEADARASDADIRAFEPGPGWPFVGVVLSYRGPPDEALLEAFKRSFRIERR